MKNYVTYEFSIGKITLAEQDGAITDLTIGDYTEGVVCETAVLQRACAQLRAYFAGELTQFDLPLAPKGTPFQQRVWASLKTIPYGQTRSYRQLAEAVGCAKGCRAVGGANGKNPIMIMIPCHRVIGADGSLAGFSAGTEIKRKLLQLEGVFFKE